jgi:streptomycin 6-kinase
VISGNCAIMQPARTSDGKPAMLRIGIRNAESAHDWLALSLWDGDGAVRMFDYDLDDGVMLLERLDHTRNLDTLPIDEAVIVAGTLRARLSTPAPMGIRTLETSAQRWAEGLQEIPGLGEADLAIRPRSGTATGGENVGGLRGIKVS